MGDRSGTGFHEPGCKYGGTFGAKRTVLIDYPGLPVGLGLLRHADETQHPESQ